MLVPRFKTALIAAIIASVIAFTVYFVPAYRDLLAHQPSRDAVHPTSYPPSAAFIYGACFALVGFATTFFIFVFIWVLAGLRNDRKNT